jgi:hypothetical protein
MADSIGPVSAATNDEDLTLVLGFVDQYLDATHDARVRSERARDYKDGYQWTAKERKTLANRNQPCITNNRIKPKVQFLKGMEQQTRTDPKAYPRYPDKEDEAQVSTDALRFIEDNNHSKQEFSRGFEYYLVEGTEGHEIIVEPKNDILEIKHNVLQWDRLWWDPHSRREDFRDARWLGTKQWMDLAEGKEKFPDAPEKVWTIDDAGSSAFGTDNTHEDRPNFFVDSKRQRVCVFFCYFLRRAVWHYTIFTKSGFIKEPIESPYLDDQGIPEPQFEFQSSFVDIEGNRFGEVDSYLDLQDEVNKRRSKLLHLISVRQTFGNKGALGEKKAHEIKQEMAKPDGHIEVNDGEFGKDFGIIPTADMASGQSVLLIDAKQEIDSQGANAALAGTEARQLSGRALQSLQQGGSVELGPLFDGQRFLKNRVHRMMWNRAKQFWTEERWIRVTDNENKLKFTRINGKIKLGDQISMKFEEEGIESLSPEEIQMVETNDPRLNTVVDVENPIKDMDVDIIIDEAPDTVTLQQEQFDILARLYEANPNAVPFELIIKASQLRNKDELVQLLEGGTDEQKEAMAQVKQQEEAEAKEFQKAAAAAEIKVDESTAEKNIATANKTNQEAKQIVVETALEVQESLEPQTQTA